MCTWNDGICIGDFCSSELVLILIDGFFFTFFLFELVFFCLGSFSGYCYYDYPIAMLLFSFKTEMEINVVYPVACASGEIFIFPAARPVVVRTIGVISS